MPAKKKVLPKSQVRKSSPVSKKKTTKSAPRGKKQQLKAQKKPKKQKPLSKKPADGYGYRNILIREYVIDSSVMDMCHEYAHAKSEESARMGAQKLGYLIPVDEIEDVLRELLFNIIATYIEPFYNVRIDYWERPQLYYQLPGHTREVGADAEIPVADSKGKISWKRVHDRDISLRLYLDDNYYGGLLSFPQYNIRFEPRTGMMVAFPSTSEYLNGDEDITRGARMVLYTWMTVAGGKRLKAPPRDAIRRKDME